MGGNLRPECGCAVHSLQGSHGDDQHLGEGIAADFDADGRLAGIEVLDAVKRLGDPSVVKRVTLEDVAIAR